MTTPTPFIQTGPHTHASYESDPLLRELLSFKLESSEFQKVDEDLRRFSLRLDQEVFALGKLAEANPPTHIAYSPWGERIDEIQTSSAWQRLDQIAAEEGLIAIGYERQNKTNARLHQFAKLYLFHPASAFYTCPLAMTDGAAKLIETHDFKSVQKEYEHIISRDPKEFWTSGQWMTERSGGSDVSRTETIARFENGQWHLYGTKWFTSATTSQMAMTLARIEDEKGVSTSGSRGLSLFCVHVRNSAGKLNNIEILRLKDKLGTKALPTAELELKGTSATLLGNRNEGVKTIATLFNVTRIYNACTTIGSFRHVLNLSHDYSHKREAFKQKIAHWPLHRQMLAQAEVEFAGLFMLTFFATELLGREENPQTPPTTRQEAQALLRLLTPIAKLMTAKRNMIWTSELIEGFGGAGYIEDTGLPKWLRDAQVFPIWEGTTNVLSLDVLRALGEENSLASYLQKIQQIQSTLKADQAKTLKTLAHNIEKTLTKLSPEELAQNARNISLWLGEAMALALLLEFAARPNASERDKALAQRYQLNVRQEILLANQEVQDDYDRILR